MSPPRVHTDEGPLVDCDLVRDQLADGIPSDDLADHAATCAGCGALLADDALLARILADARPDDPAPPRMAALLDAFQATVSRETGLRARLRRLPSAVHLGIALGLAASVVVGVSVGAPRPDLDVYPRDRMLMVVGALANVAIGGLALAVRGLHLAPAPDALRRLVTTSLIALPLALAALPAAHLDHVASTPGDPARAIVGCFVGGSIVTVALVGALRLLDRRSRPDPSALVPTVAACAVVANLALQLHCPVTSPAHLVAGHGLIGVAFALAAAARR